MSFDFSFIKQPSSLILKNDPRIETYKDNPSYLGNPDAVYLARDVQDLSQILAYCHQQKIPVTIAGSRTSIVGSSAADSGLVVELEKMDRVLDIGNSQNGPVARVQPGVILSELKDAVRSQNYFYPPDPTSYREASVGGSVATNATGEDSFLYGATRKYVQELKILQADGRERVLTRKSHPKLSFTKNTAGYCLEGDEIDQIIGSEGTLALITEVTVSLLPREPDTVSILVPFTSFLQSLSFVVKILGSALAPRALELIGPGAYEIMNEHPDCPPFHQDTKSILYLKFNIPTATQTDEILSACLQHIEQAYQENNSSALINSVFVAQDPTKQDLIRRLRHFIPLTVNERWKPVISQGGGKISTDWWVPAKSMVEMMMKTFQESIDSKLSFLVFGHIGNGHPHWNYLTKNPEEKKSAMDLVKGQCVRAVSYGGGVAGEHGIGKLKRQFLEVQHSQQVIEQMKSMKQKWDAQNILGQGNLFTVSSQR